MVYCRESGSGVICGPTPISSTTPRAQSGYPGSGSTQMNIIDVVKNVISPPPPSAPGLVPTPGIPGYVQRTLPGGEDGYYNPLLGEPDPGWGGAFERAIPGGETGFTDRQEYNPHGPIVKTWFAGGVPFGLHQDGYISVVRKNGTVKTYKPYRPTVFGKQLDAKKLAKVVKRHKGVYKELHKIFRTKGR